MYYYLQILLAVIKEVFFIALDVLSTFKNSLRITVLLIACSVIMWGIYDGLGIREKNSEMIRTGHCQKAAVIEVTNRIRTVWYCNGKKVVRLASESDIRDYLEEVYGAAHD